MKHFDKGIYKIEVDLNPSTNSENSAAPFFWIILGDFGHGWCNEGCGWAATPEEAWAQAYRWYVKYKLKEDFVS